ncbi:ABATE domain-containing protein, partial [Streptomyces sp. NPDC059398]|uniref:ABATE domain-containing protein n=1 Tax=Streptomyces sp. NPDC059398 TaxID=3346820 RepID=UPI00368EA31D
MLTPNETLERTAALINVLSLEAATPGQVAEVLRAHGETGELALSARDMDGLRASARALREVFTAEGTAAAASAVNRLLRRSTGRLRLTSHDGTTPWHPHLDRRDDAPWGEWFLASSCLALAVRLWDRQRAARGGVPGGGGGVGVVV